MLTLALALSIGTPAPTGYALVVTNNRSLDLSRPDLHFADDDGIKYAQLFTELFGANHVTLLTDLDPESQALYPEWRERTTTPTRAAVLTSAAGLAASVEADANVYLVFAGHGDIDQGQGFIELADGRFTARNLDELVGRLAVARVHVILDSCNSYFMLNPRAPGVKRWEAQPTAGQSLMEKHEHVGALISTSAEEVTYEWSELQSGIFSYELRSGLRGAADADNDGRVTYAELHAFITVANAALKNDLYRPKVFASGPGGNRDEPVLVLHQQEPRELVLREADARRLTVRDASGVRVADIHKEDGTAVTLRLPAGELEAFELSREDGRTVATRRTLLEHEQMELDALEILPMAIASRGESPVFDTLFDEPFGIRALTAHLERPTEQERHFGVSRRDAERLGYHLRMSATLERDDRQMLGFVSLAGGIGIGLAGVGALSLTTQINDTQPDTDPLNLEKIGIGYGIAGGLLAALGAYLLLSESESESIFADYQLQNFSTEAGRAAAVLDTEALWHDRVEDLAGRRRAGAITNIALGGVMAAAGAVGIVFTTQLDREELKPTLGLYSASLLAVGGMAIGIGVYGLDHFRVPVERTWELYQQQRDAFGSMPDPKEQAALELDVAPTTMGQGGGGLLLMGKF